MQISQFSWTCNRRNKHLYLNILKKSVYHSVSRITLLQTPKERDPFLSKNTIILGRTFNLPLHSNAFQFLILFRMFQCSVFVLREKQCFHSKYLGVCLSEAENSSDAYFKCESALDLQWNIHPTISRALWMIADRDSVIPPTPVGGSGGKQRSASI